MKINKLLLPASIIFMFACSPNQESTTETKEVKTEEVEVNADSKEDTESSNSNDLIGTWHQIAKNCDAEGENGEKLKEPKPWVFTESTIERDGDVKDYTLDNDKLVISGNDWRIAKQTKKRMILHHIKSDRYIKLEKIYHTKTAAKLLCSSFYITILT